MKTKESNSYYIKDINTGQFLKETDTFTFCDIKDEDPIKLTYSKAIRFAKRIQMDPKIDAKPDLYLITSKS